MVSRNTLSSVPRSAMLRLDNQLCFALYSTSLTMTKLYKPLLDRLGLTYPQYLAMLVLWEANELTVSELGQRLYLDSGTLTPLLKRLEAAGWLKRERDAADERRVIVSLTPEGRKLRDKAAGVPEIVASATQCSLSDLSDLKKRLQRLRSNLSAHLDSSADEAA
jgi:MarR family transcriptional regulator, organic hydroperoxide resistance regulator